MLSGSNSDSDTSSRQANAGHTSTTSVNTIHTSPSNSQDNTFNNHTSQRHQGNLFYFQYDFRDCLTF